MLKLEKDLKEALGERFTKRMATSVGIAKSIAEIAHKGQKRLDGSGYLTHPMNMATYFYYDLAKVYHNEFDVDDLHLFKLPYSGVLEVCLLHDVLEDTSYTEEEIADVFSNHEMKNYYEMYIKQPLLLITHDKSEPYPIYIDKVCENPISALVKFLDLFDNTNPFSLDKFEDKELKRMQDYCLYLKTINDKYHFIEHFRNYHSMLDYFASMPDEIKNSPEDKAMEDRYSKYFN